jgi:RimJ/RimL family protein N-acetyltransferase
VERTPDGPNHGGGDLGTEPIVMTERLRLEPLSDAHLDALFPVLDDSALHEFIGGEPQTELGLARWIDTVNRAAPEGERWLNWVVCRRVDGEVVGTVQATIVAGEASIAWVVGTPFQGNGYAKEAAAGMAGWLTSSGGVTGLRAAIHPDHEASQAVARWIGLRPTEEVDDGEIVWRGPARRP